MDQEQFDKVKQAPDSSPPWIRVEAARLRRCDCTAWTRARTAMTSRCSIWYTPCALESLPAPYSAGTASWVDPLRADDGSGDPRPGSADYLWNVKRVVPS